jgi:hypothetical protein
LYRPGADAICVFLRAGDLEPHLEQALADGAEAASPRALASMAVAGGLCRLISLLAFRGHAPSVGLHTARRLRACRAVCDLVLWRMSPQVQDRLRKCGVLSLPLRLLWCADPAVVSLTVLALSYATKKSRHNAAHVRTELDAIMAARRAAGGPAAGGGGSATFGSTASGSSSFELYFGPLVRGQRIDTASVEILRSHMIDGERAEGSMARPTSE